MKINFKPTRPQIILGVVSLVVFIGSLLGVTYLVSTWCLTPLPGVAVNGCGGTSPVNPQVTQVAGDTPPNLPTPVVQAPQADLPPTWDGASRVTLLVLGLDSDTNLLPEGASSSPDRSGPPRSDTMILLTVDPQTHTAGMVSIPRDLWVNIPHGFGYNRINTAYSSGEGNKLPGGGPQLAMEAVEQVMGVPIQYYAQVEFWAFSQFIDDIGKIRVYVPKKITIDPVGPGADDFVLSADWHWLNGSRALAYVRNRHTADGDVDRSRRQQDVIFAIRDRILDPSNFPTLVANSSYLYDHVQAGVHTNMTFPEMMSLGMLVKDIPPQNIKRGVIDNTMVTFGSVSQGGTNAQVLKPIPDKIRELRDSIFTSQGALSPLATGADALDLAKQENATVSILNGSSTNGLANRTADYLKSQGINVVSTGNPTEAVPGYTVVIDHRGQPYILKYLKELFHLSGSNQVISRYDAAASADVEIILGDDWAANNPMP